MDAHYSNLVLPLYLMVKFGLITFIALYFYNALHADSGQEPVKARVSRD